MTSTNDAREALRECPFCGGEAYYAPVGNGIWCKGCEVEMHAGKDGIPDVAENWNNRSLPAPAPAAGEAVAWGYFREGYAPIITTERLAQATLLGATETPLYAAPQPPEQCANIAQKSEQAPATGGEVAEIVAWLRTGNIGNADYDEAARALATAIESGEYKQ